MKRLRSDDRQPAPQRRRCPCATICRMPRRAAAGGSTRGVMAGRPIRVRTLLPDVALR